MEVKLVPSSLTFAVQRVGTTSSARDVTVTNTSSTPLSITEISLTGVDPADFTETNGCGSSVAAGASCSISVEFKPTQTGTRSAICSIADNCGGSPQSVALSGSGLCSPRGATYSPPCCAGLKCQFLGLRAFCELF
jgi:hypothetical protein